MTAAPPDDPGGDLEAFIRGNLPVVALAEFAGLRMHQADATSGLARLGGRAPYWAYRWAGGEALARHVLTLPQTVEGRRVLDLGCGGGLVGLAALKAGSAAVVAADTDPAACVATRLNAALNGLSVTTVGHDLLAGPPPDVDLILVGDLFYNRPLAARVSAYLGRCVAAGLPVLVGDPGRRTLPLSRLERRAAYPVRDMDGFAVEGGVYAFRPR
jgi:predicted nicotinamide N-methyase